MGSKKLPTIDIKGKEYVMVKDRVLFFNDTYTKGMIQPDMISGPTDTTRTFKAIVTPDISTPSRYFTGHASERVGAGMINETSATENAETSAVGRALAMMGIGVTDSIASGDEVHKAINASKTLPRVTQQVSGGTVSEVIPFCSEHKVNYFKQQKGDKTWFSHKIAGTEGWCNHRPEQKIAQGLPVDEYQHDDADFH